MLALATGNNSSDAVDIGFYGLYDDSGSQDEYAGLFRDAGDQSGNYSKIYKQSLPPQLILAVLDMLWQPLSHT